MAQVPEHKRGPLIATTWTFDFGFGLSLLLCMNYIFQFDVCVTQATCIRREDRLLTLAQSFFGDLVSHSPVYPIFVRCADPGKYFVPRAQPRCSTTHPL
jgi:hypothetical protein